MPQDGLRSALYRSFVTCDDPKGVVTCRTIRKSKHNSSHKMENRKKQISLRKMESGFAESLDSPESKDTAFMASSREEETALHSPASFQLMEVSRGAQKLNKMIECWSRGVALGAQSNDIAKDLLRGAIDLQDSLVMLGKLQEASRYMARLKRRQGRRAGPDGESGFRKGGNSGEELKRVIRESLVKQQLVVPAERASLGSGSGSEDLSLSSSSSSRCCPSAAGSSQSPSAAGSVATQAAKGAKRPNLIAKLMGLEECPSRPLLGAMPENRFEVRGRGRGQRRPVFDIDAPRARMPRRAAQEADPERRSLKEILESMQFKGLLRSNSSEGLRPGLDRSPRNAASYLKPRLIDDGPPIVLIKPLRVPCPEPKETSGSAVEEEDPLYRRKMLRQLRRTEELQPKAVISCRERASKSDKKVRKQDEEVAREQRVIVEAAAEVKEVATKANASVKSRASRPAKRNEGIEKQAEKIPKAKEVNKKSSEKDVVKSRIVPKPEDQAKRILVKARKPDSESNIAKSQNSRQPSAKPSSAKQTEQASACSSTYQKKNNQKKEKPLKKPNWTKSVTHERKVEFCSESDSHEVTIDTSKAQLDILEDQLLKEDTEISGSEIEVERCGDDRSSLREATPSTPSLDREADTSWCKNADSKAFSTSASLRALLTSSLSFQNRAEELFDLAANGSSISQPSPARVDGFGESSAKLFLDCANELIERKSILDSQTAGPILPTRVGGLRRCVSLETLVEEACDGVEALRSYSELASEGLPVDCLYAMLARDMASRGAASGIWDSGWRAGFSPDDAEQVVNDVERMVLSGLIEEVFA